MRKWAAVNKTTHSPNGSQCSQSRPSWSDAPLAAGDNVSASAYRKRNVPARSSKRDWMRSAEEAGRESRETVA